MKNVVKGKKEENIVWELKQEGDCIRLYANSISILSIYDNFGNQAAKVYVYESDLKRLGFEIEK